MKKGLGAFVFIMLFGGHRPKTEAALLPTAGMAGHIEVCHLLLPNATLPPSGKIVIEFPDSFSLKPLRTVRAFADAGLPHEVKLSGFDVSGQQLKIGVERGISTSVGTVLFELDRVQYPRQAKTFQIQVSLSVPRSASEPESSLFLPLTVAADVPANLVIAPPKSSKISVGRLVELVAEAKDRFGNPVPDIPLEWRLKPGSTGDGAMLGNRFFGTRAGSVEIAASSGALISPPLILKVVAGGLDHFEISGTPDSTTAGVPFPGSAGDSVVVSAQDQFGNTVANFADTIFFSSNDPLAVLPAPYVFTVGTGKDNGRHAFPGSQFVLKTAGSKTITVSADGKTSLSSYVQVLPNYLADFLFLVPPEVVAGKPFDVSIAGGVDIYGNPASGEVIISPVLGGGASPSGAVPAFNPVVVLSGSGHSQQTLVSTQPTLLRASNGYFAGLGDTIAIRPAALGSFSLSLLPDTLVAGDTLSSFFAEVRDRFGNRKTDFGGTAYFSSSDPKVILQYAVGSPYTFSSADFGRHLFPGRVVTFLSRGMQSLTFGNDSVRSPGVSFLILAGPPVAYAVLVPAAAAAGTPFNVSVQNAVDYFGNPVSLSVQIGLKSGSGISPSGDLPVLPTVAVSDGAGQAPAVLPKAEKAVLEGVSGTLRFSSDTVLVRPAGLEKFEWNLNSPQISGVGFSAPATLTAKDRFGNVQTDFDASSDSVVLTSQPSGSWQNNLLKQQGDFVSGRADLSALGTTFFAPAGNYVFSATSAGGKTGNSAPIEIRSVFVDSFALAPANLIRGQNISLGFRVTNQSPGAFELQAISLLAAGRTLVVSLPALPDTLAPSEKRGYSASASVPEDFPLGKFSVQLAMSGRFGPQFSTILTPVLDTLTIADSLFIRPVAGGLNFDRASKGRPYSFQVKLANQSNFDVVLDTTTRMLFARSGYTRSFRISGVTLLPQNGEGSASFLPDSFPSGFPSGYFAASLMVFGRRDGVSLTDSFSLGDSIFLENPSRIYYVTGSLRPKSALLELPLNFTLQCGDGGEAAFQADTLTRLVFSQGPDTLAARLQAAVRISPGAPVGLNFSAVQVPQFQPRFFYWKATLLVSGTENGLNFDSVFSLSDSAKLYPHPKLVMDTVWATTASVNRTNSDRSFQIRARLFNPSGETLSVTWLYLKEGESQLGSIGIPLLVPGDTVVKELMVPADSTHLGSTTYRIEVVPGYGTATSAPALLTVRFDQLTMLRQRKALLELQPEIVSPASAQGGTLMENQNLAVAVPLHNLGEAPVSSGRVRLKVVPPILTFISDSIAPVSVSQAAVFQLAAQNVLDSGRLVASWSQIPADSNTAAPAQIISDSAWLAFRILPSRAGLTVSVSEKPNPLMYADAWTSPIELAFTSADLTGSHFSLIKKIEFGISGVKNSIDFSGLEGSTLSDGLHTVTGVVEGDLLSFGFAPAVVIGPGEAKNFVLSLQPKATMAGSLRLHTGGDMIEALDSVPGVGVSPAVLMKADGQPFQYTSSVFTTAAGAGLAASLVAFPNPFSPPAQKIQIAYRLSAASEVNLKIYTLIGGLVVEKDFASGSAGGSLGVNQVEWDGTNGRGEPVKNGVYLVVISSKATGETVKQKLAVVR